MTFQESAPFTMATLAENLLREALSPEHVQIIDNSASHAGHHEGGKLEGTHLQLTIQASALNGLSKVAQHRRLNHILAPCFERGLHALQIFIQSR